MPEKSGMGVALCVPLSAVSTACATVCAAAGVAANVADVATKRKCRCIFTLPSLSWFALRTRVRISCFVPSGAFTSAIV
jgi:hypothetical protein